MARTNNLTDFLTDVSSAIKQKTGDNTPIPASEFDTEILSIETGGNYQSKTLNVTQNGNYNLLPDQEFDAISNVSISVSVSPVLQNKTVTENGSYSADNGYDGLGTVIVNVPSGSGDVKLFETEQAMQADPNPSEGDLAVVYRDDIVIPSPGDTISSITPPNTVVFDTAITSSALLRLRGNNLYLDCRLTSTQFYIRDMYGTIPNVIGYTSSDGITYTRTDSGETSYDLGEEVTIPSTADTNILQFLQSGGMVFEGLYEYKHISKGSFIPTLDITKQNILAAVNGDTVANANTNTIYVMNKYTELNSAYAGILIQNSSLLKTYKDSQGNTVNIRLVTEAIFYDPGRIITVYNNDVYLCDQASYNADDLVAGWNKGYYTLQNDTITFHKATTGSDLQLSIKPGSGNWVNGQILSGQSFILSSISTNNASTLDGYMVLQGAVSIYDVTNSAFTSHSITNNSISVEEWGYVIADTQLTLSQANQLLPDIIGYGKNGIIVGDGSIYNSLKQSEVYRNIYGFSSSSTNITNSLKYNNADNSPYIFSRVNPGEYHPYYLKETNSDDVDATYIDSQDIFFSTDSLLEYADLFNIENYTRYGRFYPNSDNTVIAVTYTGNSYDTIILDIVNKNIIRTLSAISNVKYYNHKLYYTKEAVSTGMTDKNIYKYDLDTDTETVFTSIPTTTKHTKETVQSASLVWCGNRGIAYEYSKVSTSGYTQYNDAKVIAIDLSTEVATTLSEITYIANGGSIVSIGFSATSIFFELDRFRLNGSSTINPIFYKFTNGVWTKIAEGYTNRKIPSSYSGICIEKENFIYCNISTYAHTIQKSSLTSDVVSTMPINNAATLVLTLNNVLIRNTDTDQGKECYVITDITDDGTTVEFVLDSNLLFINGYRGTFLNSNKYSSCLLGDYIYIDTEDNTVQFNGQLVTDMCKPKKLSIVTSTDQYDIMAVDISTGNNISYARLIPLNKL